MRTVAIINQKGGCGKTTTAINLSAVVAGEGKRVLLIDLDPQSHCAVGLAVPEARIERQIGDLLLRDLTHPPNLSEWVWQVRSGLDLLPSTMALAGLEAPGRGLTMLPDRDRRLELLLASIADQYDWCVLDCPPSVGLLTFNALRAATNVIIPVETSFFALQGAEKQVQTICTVRNRLATNLQYALLPTMFDDRIRLSREILDQLKKRFVDQVTPRPIRYCIRLREAASFGQPIVEYDGEADSSNDYRALFRWIVANLPEVLSSDQPQSAGRIPDAETARALSAANRAALLQASSAPLAGNVSARVPQPQTAGIGQGIPAVPAADLPSQAQIDLQEAAAASLEALRKPHESVTNGHESPPTTTPPTTTNPSPTNIPPGRPTQASPPEPLAPQSVPPAFTAAVGVRSGHGGGSFIEESVTAEHHPVTPSNVPGARAAELAQRTRSRRDNQAIFQDRRMEVRGLDDAIRHYERPATPAALAQSRRLSGARQTRQGVLFVYPGLSPSQQVSVVGDFNDWSATANPMRYNDHLQLFEACLPIPTGRHEYQFFVDGKPVEHPSMNAYDGDQSSDPVMIEVLPVGI